MRNKRFLHLHHLIDRRTTSKKRKDLSSIVVILSMSILIRTNEKAFLSVGRRREQEQEDEDEDISK